MNAKKKTRIFLVDDHPIVRQGLARLLSAESDLEVCGEAEDEPTALQALHEAIENSVAFHKMQTMNQSLAALVVYGTVKRETAMSASANPGDLDLLLRKLVGATKDGSEGDDMEATSDFSKILQLQEVKKHYDDLQERHADEINSRDQEIARLRAQVDQASGSGTQQVTDLQQENQRLTEQIKLCKDEYEKKLQRLNATVQAMKAKTKAPEPEPDQKKRGFFR